ncbi:MAG: hypothetical protein ACRDKE_04215 [Solirubrobacterales bacterium]
MTRITVSSSEMGKSCPYCRFPVKSGTEAERCDACNAIHHTDCWEDGDGCAVLGCENNAASRGESGAAPAPPTQSPEQARMHPNPVPMGKQLPAAVEPAALHQGSSSTSNRLLIGVVAVVGVLVGTVLVLGIVKLTSGSDTPVQAATTEESSDPDSEGGADSPSSSERNRAKRAVISTLRRYENAYSNQDPERLRSVFTNGVSRFGNVSGSCGWTYGINDVISAAQSNMTGDSYELVGLSAGDVNLIGSDRLTKATVNARYSFGGGEAAKIRFVLVPKEGGWRASKVDAFCGSHQPF